MVQALGLLLVLLSAFYVYAHHQVGVLERQSLSFDEQVKAGLERVKALAGATPPADDKALDTRIAELEGRLHANEQLLGQTVSARSEQGYVAPLRALARHRVEGVWLTTITLEGDSGELSLIGRALRPELVPEYIDRLTNDPAMRGRRFATLSIEREPAPKPAAGAPAASSDVVVFRLMASAGSEDK